MCGVFTHSVSQSFMHSLTQSQYISDHYIQLHILILHSLYFRSCHFMSCDVMQAYPSINACIWSCITFNSVVWFNHIPLCTMTHNKSDAFLCMPMIMHNTYSSFITCGNQCCTCYVLDVITYMAYVHVMNCTTLHVVLCHLISVQHRHAVQLSHAYMQLIQCIVHTVVISDNCIVFHVIILCFVLYNIQMHFIAFKFISCKWSTNHSFMHAT